MLQQGGATPLPNFFVGKTITNNRVTQFMATKHGLLSDALGKTETRAIWYSRDHVEQWLQEIDKAEGDGLRVYFGAYSENEDYAGQLCLLMVVTQANTSNGSHTDITIEDAPDFEARAFKAGNGRNRDFNIGSPCPPICDEGIGFPEPE
jgi:hypothetical protein